MSRNGGKKIGKRKNSTGGDEEMDDDGAKEEPMTRKERFKKWLKTTSLSTGIGAMVSMQASTQVYASFLDAIEGNFHCRS
jgi:hypothetical protein